MSLSQFQMSISELVKVVAGDVVCGDTSGDFVGINSDTRADIQGMLFVPFIGENFDGHDFLLDAQKKGARVALVHNAQSDSEFDQMTVIKVADTLKAFQVLANYWRNKVSAKIVAITGSNGKTTTKEFAATLINPIQKTAWSQKSFNNHWGVPLSLLSIEKHHEVALIEMGMNHSGEIAELCKIAEPDVATVVFVGKSHLEGLGSVEGVAKAKQEIYEGTSDAGVGVFNLDNQWTRKMKEEFSANFSRVLTFSQNESADVQLQIDSASMTSLQISGHIGGVAGGCRVEVFGRHNITNLMAAASLALAVGIDGKDIWQNLPLCKASWGRGEFLQTANGATVLFDGYNANPESMAALLKSLPDFSTVGRRFAVIGEMAELGSDTENEHFELAQKVAQAGFAAIYFVGPSKAAFERGLKAANFSEKLFISDSYEESLALKIANMLEPEDIAIVKGSRSVSLERVLSTWEASRASEN